VAPSADEAVSTSTGPPTAIAACSVWQPSGSTPTTRRGVIATLIPAIKPDAHNLGADRGDPACLDLRHGGGHENGHLRA
jgi:hypothetical protein